ncbi:unnamed protein product, partial [Musa acuminata var. zebrina]
PASANHKAIECLIIYFAPTKHTHTLSLSLSSLLFSSLIFLGYYPSLSSSLLVIRIKAHIEVSSLQVGVTYWCRCRCDALIRGDRSETESMHLFLLSVCGAAAERTSCKMTPS